MEGFFEYPVDPIPGEPSWRIRRRREFIARIFILICILAAIGGGLYGAIHD